MSKRIELAIKKRTDIESRCFGTIETTTSVTVPEGCVAVIAIRKRYGSKGLFITSPFLWGPWQGCPKLDIANLSGGDVELIQGEAIAHVAIVKEVDLEGSVNDGLHDHNGSGQSERSATGSTL